MIHQPYSKLIAIKQWADRGLYDVVGQNFDRLNSEEAPIMLRILDHIHVVDKIFQHHLRGLLHAFQAPRPDKVPVPYLYALTGWGQASWLQSVYKADIYFDDLRNLEAWYARIRERPAVRKALGAEGLK